MRLTARWIVAAVIGALVAWPAMAQTTVGEAGDFDYYLLALSWSPTHCAQTDRPSEQCREGHDTVLHGLWPQYERGWPQYCSTSHPLRLPAGLLDAYDAMTPDRGLLAYQWRKHGTCAGLAPEDYFETAHRFWRRIKMPKVLEHPRRRASFGRDDLMARIAGANQGLAADMFVITCEGARLDEIRICFDRKGDFRQCGQDVLSKTCRRSPMIVLPVQQR